jgi:hypothetical protein
MFTVERRKTLGKLTFASAVSPNKASETNAILLAESIRAFAASLSQAPIWFFTPESEKELSLTAKNRLHASNVTLIPFKIEEEILRFPLASEVLAASMAESTALRRTEFLAWLGANTIVLKEPKDFLLRHDKNLGFRPVHHTLIGSRYDKPLDPFWTLIYRYCNVPNERIFPMSTHVDGTRIRPYFNAGMLVVRPEKHLLQAWRDTFFKVYREPSLQEFYQRDGRYRVFIHQAVLSGVILSRYATDEMQELPPRYNYPLHLHAEDVTDQRPSSLEELVTIRHEGFYEDPRWNEKVPAKEPLKDWIASHLL